jgi:hypothetical protein
MFENEIKISEELCHLEISNKMCGVIIKAER